MREGEADMDGGHEQGGGGQHGRPQNLGMEPVFVVPKQFLPAIDGEKFYLREQPFLWFPNSSLGTSEKCVLWASQR
uniref:Uncharacterized protein n=1 Tax=Candidatus Kentrum sp. MB TaxID=2138164 RepID=A0A450XMJ9_9GAMM|nr:MAG: hypothetical protein BECKMB1821G_GA0114241_100722 [Candidatus Kentron sp. MB]VFK30486.1 MAG: hypothetical protein BECKMB1821I_GA0114274_10163 [Candidatus Kentron sp. MB]VFK75271.1 MAG: hypothetical protein BECKMB1821H_GA0114242_10193 [Candidatus Kentron sp. MB]